MRVFKSPYLHREDTMKEPTLSKWLDQIDHLLYNVWFKLWFQLLDNALSSLILTSQEKLESNSLFWAAQLFKFVFWLAITALTTPIGLATYFVWFALFRRLFRYQPYRLSVSQHQKSSYVAKDRFEILSINVCLLPETVSRMNNLSASHRRLESIGSLLNKAGSSFYSNGDGEANGQKIKIIHDMIDRTDLDFVCMQEVWSIDTAKRLRDMLHHKFGYVLYDAGNK
jgi:hypothetical protein